MRRLLFSIFTLTLLSACDDGDIIVTNFDFEDSTLRFCDGADKNVIYAVNNDDVFESISLEFRDSQFEVDENGDLIPPDEEQIEFPLSGNNRMIYRIYKSEVPTASNQYFCSSVPPSQPAVVQEWLSGDGATVFVNTGFIDETSNADPDNDGLTNSGEGWDPDGVDHQDTDEDGIPDYLDIDDDGDNVSTRSELQEQPADEDEIPNYLDNDDDDDGILTRFEVSEDDPDDPRALTTAEGIPNYLNDQQTSEYIHDEYIDHDISRGYGFQILIENLKFTKQDGSGESIQFQTYNLGTLRSQSIDFPQCPAQDPDCEDTDTDNPDEGTEDNG